MLRILKKNIERTFIRLYNDACGRPDTTFKVSNDTLFFQIFNLETREYEFEPEFTITFLSSEKLMLKELDSDKEITYCSLMTIPATGETLSAARFYEREGAECCEFNSDSIRYGLQDEVSMCPRPPNLYNDIVDSLWFNRLQNLYVRVTPDEILFARNRKLKIVDVYEGAVLYEPMACTFTVEMTGTRGLERIDDCGNVVNPVLRALHWEIYAAIRSH